MKKLIVLMAIVIAGCTQPADKKQSAKACKYTCTMDKDVCADKPGICPKCGMDLVEKDNK